MTLSIIMYHYVRDIDGSAYPRIKGLRTSAFIEQLEYIARHYNVISPQQLIEAVRGGQPLPARSALLTFDDGYIDHFETVRPLLNERGWSGAFFPPSAAALEGQLLDVNKIHYILARHDNPSDLMGMLNDCVDKAHEEQILIKPSAKYMAEYYTPDRFDDIETAYTKRMLQKALPENIRSEIIDVMFKRYVSDDPIDFGRALYMDVDQLGKMLEDGMHIGSHGARHYWLSHLSAAEQQIDIDASLEFLASIGAPTKQWIMCYPYGDFDDNALSLLRSRDCAIGLTTQIDLVSELGALDPLTLPRLDTNDLPVSASAEANEWTRKAV